MALSQYPASLPELTGLSLAPDERRASAGMDATAPATVRGLQREYGADGTLAWTLTGAQYDAWLTWWRDTLDYGGAWFEARDWPMPWGPGAQVHLIGKPVVGHLGGGVRTVQVAARLRPTEELPVYTSQPYPVATLEELDVEHAVAGGWLLSWVPGEVDITHAVLGGTLSEPLKTYDDGLPEEVDITHAMTGGTLHQVLLTYDDGLPDEVDITHAMTGGTLDVVLFTYSNWPVENLDISHAMTGGTLT